MKLKRILRVIFVVVLLMLMIGLTFLAYPNTDSPYDYVDYMSKMYDYDNLTYKILNKENDCTIERELLFKDDKYNYYIECAHIKNIFIEWSNDEIHYLEDDVNTNRVTMDSLISHGLNIVREEINNEN